MRNELRICVFTGPILSNSNPYFVAPINGRQIKIPSLFWKVVIFQKEDGNLYRVGFMMSQTKLLKEHHIIEELELEDELFMQFKDADTYQVNISLIEELSGLKFSSAIDSYRDDRNKKLIFKEIDIDPDLETGLIGGLLAFVIENLNL